LKSKHPEKEKVFLVRRCMRMFRDLKPNENTEYMYDEHIIKHQGTHIKVFLRYMKLIAKKFQWDNSQLFSFIAIAERMDAFDQEEIETIINRLDYSKNIEVIV